MGCCIVGDLRNKDVINVCNGKRLGCVYDVEVDLCSGRVTAIVVPGDTRLLNFSAKNDLRIPWDRIVRVGDDTILVELADEDAFIRDTRLKKR